jgi:hypothetical protein
VDCGPSLSLRRSPTRFVLGNITTAIATNCGYSQQAARLSDV